MANVLVENGRVVGVEFDQAGKPKLTVKAKLTADSSDWGDVIRQAVPVTWRGQI